MIGWVIGFFIGVGILAFRVVAVVFVRALYLHEFAHKTVATFLGVEYVDHGFDFRSNVYRIELDETTPRQLFLINCAPVVLSLVSLFLFLSGFYFWSRNPWFAFLLFVPAVAIASHSLPSLQDAVSVFFCRSWSQPVSSFLSSLVVSPLLLFRVPALLYPRWNLLSGLSWAGVLAYASLRIHSLLIGRGVPF